MKYTDKIKYAERVAEDLTANKSLDEIKEFLKSKGLFETNITEVLISARNIIGISLKPLIREKLLANESIEYAQEFQKLDKETLIKLISEEKQALGLIEKAKVNKLLKEGVTLDQILPQVNLEFYSHDKVVDHVATYEVVTKENSIDSRVTKIFGGGGLLALGVFLTMVSTNRSGGGGKYYLGLIIAGLIILVKGFITVENPKE